MTHRTLLAELGMAVLLFAAACAPPVSQENAEIAALSDAWETALNDGDLDTLVGLYAEHARIMPPNGEAAVGHDAVRAAFSPMIDAGLGAELETVRSVSAADIGYALGTYRVTSGGEELERGSFVITSGLVDGEWKITGDIWHSDQPVGADTTTLVFTHEVEDIDRWLAAWEGEESRRDLFAAHGAPSVTVLTSEEAPSRPALLVEVADMEAFLGMLASEEGQAAAAEDTVKMDTLVTYRVR